MFQIKPIAKASIPRALERAERYRLLNEPRQAESICLDVLAIEPEHQQALAMMILALTDQFGGAVTGLAEQARQIVPRLHSAYERAYYAGIIAERYGKHLIAKDHGGARSAAYEYLADAIQAYDDAEKIAPAGNDDAILRHNTCVRIIERHHLQAPLRDDQELPLE
jgi:hypothetical protein